MALSSNKILSEVKVTMYDFDPNAATATAVAYVPMRDFTKIAAGFLRTIGTSGLTMAIYGATDSSGTNATQVVAKTISDEPNATGDYVFLETTAAEIEKIGVDNSLVFTHASLVLTFATATDEAAVVYIRGGAKFKYNGLTADYVS